MSNIFWGITSKIQSMFGCVQILIQKASNLKLLQTRKFLNTHFSKTIQQVNIALWKYGLFFLLESPGGGRAYSLYSDDRDDRRIF